MASAFPGTLQTKAIAIDSVSWTAISAPMDCNEIYVYVDGGQSVTIRTDSGDANTAKPVPAGAEWSPVGGGQQIGAGMKPRYPAGQTVAFAQAAAGTGPLRVTGLL